MRILVVSNVYPPHIIGGAEIIAHHWAKEYRAQGHEVASFAGWQMGGHEPYSEFTEDVEGLRVHRIVIPGHAWSFENQAEEHRGVAQSFRRVLREFRPDVVHSHNLAGLDPAIVSIARQSGAKSLVTLHDYWGFCHWNTTLVPSGELCRNFAGCPQCIPEHRPTLTPAAIANYQINRRYHLSQADLLISPSQHLVNSYLTAGFPAAPFRVVPNGLDYSRFVRSRGTPRPAPGPLRFVFLGHLGKHKGPELVCRAFADPGLRGLASVSLYGAGDLQPMLVDLVKELGAESSVHLMPKVPNHEVPDLLCEFDALINASIWPENAPVSMYEAMAAGLAVVASDLGGNREMICRSGGGALFRPRDVADLVRVCRELAEHPDRCAAMQRAGIEFTANNSVGRRVAEVLHHAGLAP